MQFKRKSLILMAFLTSFALVC